MAEVAPSIDLMLCGQGVFGSNATTRASSPAMKVLYCNGQIRPMLVPVQPLLALRPLSVDRPSSSRKSARRRRKKKPQNSPPKEVDGPTGASSTPQRGIAEVAPVTTAGIPPPWSTTALGEAQPGTPASACTSLSNNDDCLDKKPSSKSRSSSRSRGKHGRKNENPWAVATTDLQKTASVVIKPAHLTVKQENPPTSTAEIILTKDSSEQVTTKQSVETVKQARRSSVQAATIPTPKLRPKPLKPPFWAQQKQERPPLSQEAIQAAAEKAEAERIRAMQRIEEFRRAEQQCKANLVQMQEEKRRQKMEERLAVAREKERRRAEVYALNRLMCLSEEARVEQYRKKMATKESESTIPAGSPVKATVAKEMIHAV
mmetsp:Transcript_23970/g.52342  ORF Transcript_23970/g.52342 Transcript_23970/m.52342 type:complete len:373 (-) Transcript_23970:376-1494(-)